MAKNQNHIRFSHFLLLLCLSLNICRIDIAMAQNSSSTVDVKVGVILDADTWLGKISLSCIRMAVDDFYASHSHYKTRLILHTRNVSNSDILGTISAAVDLLKNIEVQAIIGSSTSMQTNFLASLGDKAKVPIISFSTTSPSLSSIRTPYFIRATQNDSSQAKAISEIIQSFGCRNVVLIYEDDDFGQGIIPFLTDAFEDTDIRAPNKIIIHPKATDDEILAELEKLKHMTTRVFVVHMQYNLGSRFFTKAKEVQMTEEGYVWFITDGLANFLSLMDPSAINSLKGALGVKPYIRVTEQLAKFTIEWKRKFQLENPSMLDAEINIVGLRAYDAVVALAMAAEKVGSVNFGFIKTSKSRNLTDLESFGVSTRGLELLQALNMTNFQGLGGDFNIVEGQLQTSVYEIINVINKCGRGIGYWTESHGITRSLNFSDNSSVSKGNLGAIIWPGDTIYPPRGLLIQRNIGKKLRVGVPVQYGNKEFQNVTTDPSTGANLFSGYCIDVFYQVIKMMPYNISYEYHPFENKNGSFGGFYDDLVHQVFAGEYDIAVGDITITANRSQYVDFTLPYTEPSAALIVPIQKYTKRKNGWVFLAPLTWELWVTILCSFVFISFVIWLLEHRINNDFRGPLWHQVGVMFYFSFSTMVFAHKERVLSNLGRVVMIIWLFVVLILVQSYTASLASTLTLEQLQPAITDIMELVKRRENVGYQQGSFILEFLKGIGFRGANLWPYNSSDELNELFSNGAIDAAFDEIPYVKVFIAKNCSKYVMVESTYRTPGSGFGFVFPKGSPLMMDVSRVIVNMSQGNQMADIEKKWLGERCGDNSTSFPLNNLGVESFWGLFVVVLVVSNLAILIHITTFLSEHWHILSNLEPQTSFWQKILLLARHHDEKDLNSHTYKTTGVHNGNGTNIIDNVSTGNSSDTKTSPINSCQNLSTISNNMEDNLTSHEEQHNPSRENIHQEPQA